MPNSGAHQLAHVRAQLTGAEVCQQAVPRQCFDAGMSAGISALYSRACTPSLDMLQVQLPYYCGGLASHAAAAVLVLRTIPAGRKAPSCAFGALALVLVASQLRKRPHKGCN